MDQKHKRFREFWTPFLLRIIRKNPRSMYAWVSKVMAQFVLKNRKIVPYHGANPNTRNKWRALTVSVPDYGSWYNLRFSKVVRWVTQSEVYAIHGYFPNGLRFFPNRAINAASSHLLLVCCEFKSSIKRKGNIFCTPLKKTISVMFYAY